MVQDPHFLPDPSVTANIYCAARIDDLLQRCIAPMWRSIREAHPASPAYLWVLRYRRRGEHLKVRLHCPEPERAAMRDALAGAVHAYLDGLDTAEKDGDNRADNRFSPPIDPEDEPNEPQADRTLLWTSYRRSPITFGAELFARDDRFAALFTRALGQNTAEVLSLFGAAESPEIRFSVRQSALLKTMVRGLSGPGWSRDERAGYLVYHRNWLMRYLLARSNQGRERAEKLLAQLSAKAAGMGSSLGGIEATLATAWSSAEGAQDAGFAADVRELAALADGYNEHTLQDIDPFAGLRSYPAVFKVLHGAANPLGIQPLDEAFVYHLLLRCYAPGDDRGFDVDPAPARD